MMKTPVCCYSEHSHYTKLLFSAGILHWSTLCFVLDQDSGSQELFLKNTVDRNFQIYAKQQIHIFVIYCYILYYLPHLLLLTDVCATGLLVKQQYAFIIHGYYDIQLFVIYVVIVDVQKWITILCSLFNCKI